MQGISDFFKRHSSTVAVTVATLLLITVLLTFWVDRNIFDARRFTDKSMEALSSQTARNIVANEITEQVFEDKPILNKIASEQVSALTASLLGSDIVQNQLERAVFALNKIITTDNELVVALPLQEIVDPLNAFLEIVAPQSVIDLPEDKQTIVLIDASDVYNISSVGQTLLYVGPLALLSLIALAVVSFVREKNAYRFMAYAGLVLILASLFTYIISYTSGAVLTLRVIDPDRSALMAQIYDVFVNDLRALLGWMLAGGVLLSAVGAYKTGLIQKLSKKFS